MLNCLLAIKEELECCLYNMTDYLFNFDNRITSFDQTKFYFEGAQSRESKGKRLKNYILSDSIRIGLDIRCPEA